MFYCWQLTKNKYLELSLTLQRKTNTYFWLDISWSKETDHAGFRFDFQFFKLAFCFNIYDNRHWDYELNKWEEHNGTN
jgi:hypothetical protein